MNTLQKFEAKQLAALQESKSIPAFSPGDTIRVNVRVKEGTRERIQAYEGVCIARSGSGINENFAVRKISFGEGVERVFPLWSSRIDSIELVRKGDVRRAKLYYLRDRRGKSARISERTTGHGFDTNVDEAEEALTQTQKRAQKKAAKDAKRAEARKANEDAAKTKAAAKEAEKAAAEAEAAAAAAEAPSESGAE
ncbi:MAG: 50S ribosomal protein L19 [Rhodospirillales bacterium]|nr:50S ribosomal protein L19 [Alphaproteobacteria bacterium]USO06423.1 MAG: 50S ribosomal protein L19 [Rhodospirillales bacterium]